MNIYKFLDKCNKLPPISTKETIDKVLYKTYAPLLREFISNISPRNCGYLDEGHEFNGMVTWKSYTNPCYCYSCSYNNHSWTLEIMDKVFIDVEHSLPMSCGTWFICVHIYNYRIIIRIHEDISCEYIIREGLNRIINDKNINSICEELVIYLKKILHPTRIKNADYIQYIYTILFREERNTLCISKKGFSILPQQEDTPLIHVCRDVYLVYREDKNNIYYEMKPMININPSF